MTATMWIGQWMCYHVQKEETKRDWWMIFMQTISSVFNLLTTLLLGKNIKNPHVLSSTSQTLRISFTANKIFPKSVFSGF